MNQALLKKLLHYDPETGVFVWIVHKSSHALNGAIAGIVRKSGYVEFDINRKRYRAHRLAWLYMTGKWPTNQIDHKNGDRTDNRWENLRDVTPLINSQNQSKARSDSRSGLPGAFLRVYGGRTRYYSLIQTKGRFHYLGTFPTAEAASEAYLLAKKKLHPEALALQAKCPLPTNEAQVPSPLAFLSDSDKSFCSSSNSCPELSIKDGSGVANSVTDRGTGGGGGHDAATGDG